MRLLLEASKPMNFANSVKLEGSRIARREAVDKTAANYDLFVTGIRA
jgi:hypothetical protein